MTTPTPDVEVLTPEASSPQDQPTTAELVSGSRCLYRYQNGKRCRLPGSEPQLGLCPRHFRQRLAAGLPPADDSSDLSPELLGGIKFSSAEDLREFLTRLLIQMAKGRVSPRRGAVLAYVTNQLLHSHVAAEKEAANETEQIIFDLPRPTCDDDISPEPAFVEKPSGCHTSLQATTPAEPDGYDGWSSDLEKSK